MKLTKEHQKNAIKLAGDLADDFPWHLTPQGAEYWCEVHSSLLELARDEPRKPQEVIIDGIKYIEVIDDE